MHPHLWYPYFSAKTSPEPLVVKSAQGVWLELADGRQLIDCISSWWVNTYGHSHPRIAQAIYEQAQTLEHVIFSGFSHEPAEQLATKLVARLNVPAESVREPHGKLSHYNNLQRVFYSDNGSIAVEIALKMAYQYWANQGETRSTFLSFTGAYHGDTFGAMSIGSRSIFSAVFQDLLFQVETAEYPATYDGDESIDQREAEILQDIEQKLASQTYAGIIIEPLVQGAGGMRMCRTQFLQQLRQLATKHHTLLIFDEVMTGFGRTGANFACQEAGVSPDLICLSKGITGGFLPFAVTISTEEIYQGFYSDDPLHTLYHGHSYTANPLGCAAALAGLELLTEYQPIFAGMAVRHWSHLEKLRQHPLVNQVRVQGTIAAMNIGDDQGKGYLNEVGIKIRQLAIEQGLLLRPLGNVLYLMPPYCITDEELSIVYGGIQKILNSLYMITKND
jgi:adenosylmethionine---8-amino-7-oxononanoate aminotransferase